MNIDPDRSITITLPFGMIEQLKQTKPVLSMFSDSPEIRQVIDIIDAIYAGALEYIREEEGEIQDYFSEKEEQHFNMDEINDNDKSKN